MRALRLPESAEIDQDLVPMAIRWRVVERKKAALSEDDEFGVGYARVIERICRKRQILGIDQKNKE